MGYTIIRNGTLIEGTGSKPLEDIRTLESVENIKVVMKDGQIVKGQRQV